MTSEALTEYIHNVLITIHENIRETSDRKGWADEEELTHIESRLLTYNEVLQTFKIIAREMDLPERELGL
ncbi:hypothetical protein GCM10009122_03300 [Fulvivirga kasyanovii]|uniref:Uncharacterized protein n=1 Tax=Fulvivirga kasyanovii TaxID=396812 RepID=A0ABW9RV31_9BACT|nr:hypothetical protein [Fulvivirga kasyanovii]MTI26870.1 hypothetical protein [Fulvivirga kasyanovii]